MNYEGILWFPTYPYNHSSNKIYYWRLFSYKEYHCRDHIIEMTLRLTILVEFFIVDNAIHKFRAYLATTYVHNIQKSNIIKIYMQVFSLQNLVDILTAQSYLS